MLVLTRKVGDVIAIGDNIKIVVMAIKGKQVRLGVQADKDTIVHREEVYQKIQQETRAASESDVNKTKAAGDLLKSAAANQTRQAHPDTRDESMPAVSAGRGVIRRTPATSTKSSLDKLRPKPHDK